MLLNVKQRSWELVAPPERIRLIVERRLGILVELWGLNRSK